MATTRLFFFFSLFSTVSTLTCYENEADGTSYEMANDEWKYCSLIPFAGPKGDGRQMGVGDLTDNESLTPYDATFGHNSQLYKVLTMCILEKHNTGAVIPGTSSSSVVCAILTVAMRRLPSDHSSPATVIDLPSTIHSSHNLPCWMMHSLLKGDPSITISLEGEQLWRDFYVHTNEMIVTKPGRHLFPKLTLTVKGLIPHSLYGMRITINRVDKFKYRFKGDHWQRVGEEDEQTGGVGSVVNHREGFVSGKEWMRGPVEFTHFKITNNTEIDEKHMVLVQSMHKYTPVVEILDMFNTVIRWEPLEMASFIAVTAYQNHFIKQLKKSCNPYAKGQLMKSNPDSTPSSRKRSASSPPPTPQAPSMITPSQTPHTPPFETTPLHNPYRSLQDTPSTTSSIQTPLFPTPPLNNTPTQTPPLQTTPFHNPTMQMYNFLTPPFHNPAFPSGLPPLYYNTPMHSQYPLVPSMPVPPSGFPAVASSTDTVFDFSDCPLINLSDYDPYTNTRE